MNLTRELFRLGCRLSGGIAHEHDSDEKLWKTLGVECVRVGAFERITDDQVRRAAAYVREADLTILCSFPVGPGNLGNLRLAAAARRLVVLSETAESTARSLFAPEAGPLIAELEARSPRLSYDDVVAALAAGKVPGGA